MKHSAWKIAAIAGILIGVLPVCLKAAESNADKPAQAAPQAKADSYRFAPPAPPAAVSSAPAAAIPAVPGQLAKTGGSGALKQTFAPDYIILVGDRLNVKIFPEDQYIKGGAMQVGSEGTITIPLIGRVAVKDKTIVQAEKDLVKIIDADYLVNPEVVIEVVESSAKLAVKSRKVIALGQVRKPGSYDWPADKEKMTLLELISMAGGFTEIANIKKIKIIHKENGQKNVRSVNGENVMSGSDPDVELTDGDVINVAESVF